MKFNRRINVILLLFFVLASCSSGGGSAAPVTPPVVKKIVPKYAYVANLVSGDISEFTIGTTGGLTFASALTSDLNVTTNALPSSIAIDPAGKYAYVSNSGTNTISQFMIGTDGSLAAMSTSTVAAGTQPQFLVVDPTGKYLYVANNGTNTPPDSGNIDQFTIGAGGSITLSSTTSVYEVTNPWSVTIDPSGKYLYATNSNDNTVSQFNIGSNGSLTAMSPNPTVSAGTTPYTIVVDPSGKYVYVANFCGNCGSYDVSQYTVGTNGSLPASVTTSVSAGTNPYSIAVDPSGKYVYVANIGGSPGSSSGTVSQYTIGNTGTLSLMSTPWVDTEGSPASVTVDPSGKYVYIANSAANSVSQYTIGSDGRLNPMTPASVAAGLDSAFVVILGVLQ